MALIDLPTSTGNSELKRNLSALRIYESLRVYDINDFLLNID